MIPRKFLRPVNLFKAQALNIYQLAEIIMINKDKNFKFVAL